MFARASSIMDDSDSYGVEMGLQLVEAAGGGEVSLVSMAPNSETSGLRTALAMGAVEGRRGLRSRCSPGSDALGTAKVLAAAIRRLEPDLVIAGDRVHRRLHRHDAGPGRRAPRLAVGHLRQARRDLRRASCGSGARPKPATTR